MLTYVYGAVGALILALVLALAWDHAATIPQLKAEIATAQAAEKTAESATAVAIADRAALQTTLDAQNARVRTLQSGCIQADQIANQRAETAARKPQRLPTGNTPQEITQWLNALRALP